MVTSAQLRAARSLLNWTVRELADASGVHRNTITRAETDSTVHGHAVAAVVRTLEAAGVIFVAENGEGPGVRLRKGAHRPPEGREAGADMGRAHALSEAEKRANATLARADAPSEEKARRKLTKGMRSK
jgi:transcriptional regulator with XRE-family HTH domain